MRGRAAATPADDPGPRIKQRFEPYPHFFRSLPVYNLHVHQFGRAGVRLGHHREVDHLPVATDNASRPVHVDAGHEPFGDQMLFFRGPCRKQFHALDQFDKAFPAQEEASKDRLGRSTALRPQYMSAIIDWQRSRGYTAYPDANSTLRVTYGKVVGGSPKDGLIYEPFTRLEGIVEKNTGQDPFDAPQRQLDLIQAREYGSYELPSIGSVPVNFLSDLDSTGGNSGSPTLNGRGELVGLLFDGTIESVNSDWDVDSRTTRTIHVDSRYMLWVMEKVDLADHLIEEMAIVSAPHPASAGGDTRSRRAPE